MSAPDLERLEHERKAAEARRAIAEARQKEAEAKKAADAAERALGVAQEQARRDAEKAEAETRKAVAEANVAAVKAYLPDAPTLKPLEGTVTADEKAGIVAETAAYALFEGAANAVAKEVQGKLAGARVLVVTDPQLVSSDWPYHVVTTETSRLQGELDVVHAQLAQADPALPSPERIADEEALVPAIAPESPLGFVLPSFTGAAAASALPSIVGTLADVAGYFQSNYTVAGRTFEAKIQPLVAAIAGALAAVGVKVVIDGFHTLSETNVMAAYEETLARRWQVMSARLGLEQRKLAPASADAERRRAELARRQAALAAAEAAVPADEKRRAEAQDRLESAREELHAAEAVVGELQRLVEVAKAAEQHVDAFVGIVTATPAAGGLPLLGQAAAHEVLHEGGSLVTHVLHVAVSSSGGETQTRQRRFFAPTVRYVGSCTLSVSLAETNGTVIYAGSQALVGQVTYVIKNGTLGEFKEIELPSSS